MILQNIFNSIVTGLEIVSYLLKNAENCKVMTCYLISVFGLSHLTLGLEVFFSLFFLHNGQKGHKVV